MNFKENSFRRLAVFFVFCFTFSTLPVFAQDGELKVVDEVIAVVNDGVITLSRVKRESKVAAGALAQQQGKPLEDAERELDSKRPELIANLINEELLLQEGKEMGLEKQVEESVNEDLLGIMKQLNLKTLDELYKAMRDQGEDPEEIKAAKRRQYTKFYVYRFGVESKIYNGLSEKEVKAYYETHKDKFKKPETVTLSEIFLNFAGRNPDEVKTEAAEIIKKARAAGADFAALVQQYSDRADSKAKKGSVGTINVEDISVPEVVAALKNVKAGGVTDLIAQEDGILILRVDERTIDTNTPVYDERRVREAITIERSPIERKKYLAGLRQEAYIKIADSYKAEVSAALSKTETVN
ncbi:MAG: peptidyl-prolyl cis-trans isomerase [Pyrinomonadaceae bacterium]